MSKHSIRKRQDRKMLKALAAEKTRIALRSPFAEGLERLVDRAYETFGVGHVSPGLEVCRCSVCMSEEVRQEIFATPNRLLESRSIREYTNSAHGVPHNLNDLRLLLPRYMELLAQGESICDMESDEALWRFGEARLTREFLNEEEGALVGAWGRALMLHDAWADATDRDTCAHLWATARLMLSFAFDGAAVLSGIEAAFSAPETGPLTVARFAIHLEYKPAGETFGDFIRDRCLRPGALDAMIDWIESDRFAAWLDRAAAANIPQREREIAAGIRLARFD